jgi:hypothetical protein
MWRAQLAVVFLLAGACCSCNRPAAEARPPRPAAIEITERPDVLFQADLDITTVSYEGARVDDPVSALPEGTYSPDEATGWLGLHGQDNVFRIYDGRVRGIRILDQSTLGKFALNTEQDITRLFGKADERIENPKDPGPIYCYWRRKLSVGWDRDKHTLGMVLLGQQ